MAQEVEELQQELVLEEEAYKTKEAQEEAEEARLSEVRTKREHERQWRVTMDAQEGVLGEDEGQDFRRDRARRELKDELLSRGWPNVEDLSQGDSIRFRVGNDKLTRLRPGWIGSRSDPRVAAVPNLREPTIVDNFDYLIVSIVSHNPEVRTRFFVYTRDEALRQIFAHDGYIHTAETPDAESAWWKLFEPAGV